MFQYVVAARPFVSGKTSFEATGSRNGTIPSADTKTFHEASAACV